MTNLAILTERCECEIRVAATTETVKKYVDLGLKVAVEAGAGRAAAFPDDAYMSAGAEIAGDTAATLAGADIVLKVLRPLPDEIPGLPRDALLVALLSPYGNEAEAKTYAAAGLATFAMELMPRISRAQSMDVLSAQSNLAGYKAVLEAAAHYGRAMPMMMTAAGSIAPARVMVFGAGVAGLQAIATARRLGAIVSATDVRPAAKEQVESLGATFVMVESEETKEAETSAGYAKEMSAEYKKAQAQLIEETLPKQNIAICTALIPGRKAPTLISEEMVRSMKPGSVFVDLAAEQRGNCALTRPGEVADVDGVTIIGYGNLAGRLPTDASNLYAKNLFNFISLLIDKDNGSLAIDWDDEIVKGTCLTRDGKVVHDMFNKGAA